ncbi:MAG: class I SAM-dependent methyltransferase [Spirochaetaceae bacterium]|jgi:hypothetical protein|nr:class I SAM-dependent methyltransferase [Spirochaetaceae bacterium]
MTFLAKIKALFKFPRKVFYKITALPKFPLKVFHTLKQNYENKFYTAKGYNQISNATEDNRYPEIFAYCANLLKNKTENITILSFGCSVGKECFSLRNYFPESAIIGYDINEENINAANTRNTDLKITFYATKKEVFNRVYDLVFAMSVLCRWPQTQGKKHCGKIYAYDQFKKQIDELDPLLKAGGLLIIYNANFRFTDTEASKKYDPLVIPEYSNSGFVTKFDRANNYLEEQAYPYVIFKKRI